MLLIAARYNFCGRTGGVSSVRKLMCVSAKVER